MNLTKEQVDEMNNVQLDMFLNLVQVLQKLNLKYYMIHGSLLGAVRCSGFFPYDDDIDIAMPRADYEVLMKKGQTLLPPNLFIQSSATETDYPLEFGKLRNSNTSFIQPEMRGLNINQGMYIDIFPIDYYPERTITRLRLELQNKIYKARISCRYNYLVSQPFWKSIFRCISKLIIPDWNKAVSKRANLFARIKESSKVVVIGGKDRERGIPLAWFAEGKTIEFEGIKVNCPNDYNAYLACIYGDYMTYNPAEKYMNDDGTVFVEADYFSTSIPYSKYKL